MKTTRSLADSVKIITLNVMLMPGNRKTKAVANFRFSQRQLASLIGRVSITPKLWLELEDLFIEQGRQLIDLGDKQCALVDISKHQTWPKLDLTLLSKVSTEELNAKYPEPELPTTDTEEE